MITLHRLVLSSLSVGLSVALVACATPEPTPPPPPAPPPPAPKPEPSKPAPPPPEPKVYATQLFLTGLSHATVDLGYGKDDPVPLYMRLDREPETKGSIIARATTPVRVLGAPPIDTISLTFKLPGHVSTPKTVAPEAWPKTLDEAVPKATDGTPMPADPNKVVVMLKPEPLDTFYRREFERRIKPFPPKLRPVGTLYLSSEPAGAQIVINGSLLKDAEGKPVVTPGKKAPLAINRMPDANGLPGPSLEVGLPPNRSHTVELRFNDPLVGTYRIELHRMDWQCRLDADTQPRRDPIRACTYIREEHVDLGTIKKSLEYHRGLKVLRN
ncbi:MAG: hypothetical protein AAFS10_22720 [Myxococcota bacterium]